MISKKDLLIEMNISYGQLYRWKREGLIPNEWFNKQAVSTGQETYFKRELIIPRIQKILELKDMYQLDQLRAFLNPDLEKRPFNMREIVLIEDLDPFILKMFAMRKPILYLYDIILIYIFSLCKEDISFEDYKETDFSAINCLTYTCYIVESDRKYILFAKDELIMDHHLKIIKQIRFEDVANMIAKNL
ncbi:MAG: DUF4004 family protein [Bacilli bacterium]